MLETTDLINSFQTLCPPWGTESGLMALSFLHWPGLVMWPPVAAEQSGKVSTWPFQFLSWEAVPAISKEEMEGAAGGNPKNLSYLLPSKYVYWASNLAGTLYFDQTSFSFILYICLLCLSSYLQKVFLFHWHFQRTSFRFYWSTLILFYISPISVCTFLNFLTFALVCFVDFFFF